VNTAIFTIPRRHGVMTPGNRRFRGLQANGHD